ncbi:hypothetical protein GCM10009552_32500 [Rothia nasimurium]|uniref:Uncharacterized protein n=1 Tax=Luteibacter anthropi TaxID=564369 RepID=A0A7X5UD25_9GAMM|nr:hypothetical protein [Luteibacter anthropi]NII08157.1 hypothetical protein [Luteibacter anthropi]
MKMHLMKWVRSLIALSLLVAVGASSHPVLKRKIEEDPRGTIIARVLASFTQHAGPAGLWYAAALEGRHVNTAEFSGFSRQFETATFASFTYQYQLDGVNYRRVYHARSGRNDPALGLGDITPVRRYRSFFDSRGPDVIAWDRPAATGSRVTPRPVAGKKHAEAAKRDAELKIARAIERDILNGRVPAGGYLAGFVSQEPCPSCEAALQALSDSQNIRVHVAYLDHGSPAYTIFHRQRLQHLNTIHVSVNGGQINVLNREGAVMDQVPKPVACLEPEAQDDPDDT